MISHRVFFEQSSRNMADKQFLKDGSIELYRGQAYIRITLNMDDETNGISTLFTRIR